MKQASVTIVGGKFATPVPGDPSLTGARDISATRRGGQ